MKKIFIPLAVAIIGIAAFAGCKKSSSSSTPGTSMKATINGVAFTSVNCIAISNSGVVAIDGYSGTSSTSTSLPILSLTLTGYNNTTGTFSLDGTTNIANIDSSLNTAVGSSGTLTITSASATSIVGTFSFTCPDGTTVTNGTFTAKGY